MKIQRQNAPPIVIGKRVTVGAVMAAVSVAIISYLPEHAAAVRAVEAVLVFAAQIWIAQTFGVTSGD